MIKAILFDLGNTLIPFDYSRGFSGIAPFSSCPVEEMRRRIAASDLAQRFETGRMSGPQFVREFSELIELRPLDYRQFCDIWCSIFLPETLIPDGMLLRLRENYRLVLLSNTNEIHFSMIWEKYPLLRHFHELVLSHRIGVMKPAPEIYRAAVERAGCRPEECLFTDDVPAYVDAGRREGLDAVQFQSLAELERELLARGVTW
jgi:putative hydrolase of the HAD superfamily